MADERQHLADDVLFDYADDPASVADTDVVETHLAACAECWTKLDDCRTLAGALRDEETWWLLTDLTGGRGVRTLQELVARWETEDEDAKRMLGRILESPYRFAYANIARKKRFYTGGVVRLLCEAARAECDREPEFSLSLADTACLIADALPDDYYPAAAINHLRGNAWKEYSTACRYLGRFDNSYDALDRAARAYERLKDPEIQLATVDLCRAAVLWEQRQFEEALRLARSSAQRFAERRDTERYLEAREWEAVILHRMGDVESACKTYMAAFEHADTTGDAEMKARAAKNLAIAYRDGGDTGSASRFLSIALQLYEGLEQHAMVLHTRWSIARLSLYAGNAADAAQRLPGLITEFQKLGMVGPAAHAQLDLAEALLLLGRFEEVPILCEGLVEFFRGAKILTGALTAAAFLKEAADSRVLTPRQIEHVRTYLGALERTPNLPFARPPTID